MGAVRDPSHTALKAVIAAGLAWQLGHLLGGDDVAYFAPVTALVAIHPVVASSLRESVQYGLGVLAGVVLAAAVGALVGADLLGVVLVVGLGVLIGALPPFGRNGATTAFWGLLVLLVGGTDPANYLGQRLPEAALGLAVGALVNLAVLPRTRLRPAGRALDRLRDALTSDLAAIADDLAAEPPPDDASWAGADERLAALEDDARHAVQGATDSLRWNPRGKVRGRAPAAAGHDRDLQRLERAGAAVRAIALTLGTTAEQAADGAGLDDDFRRRYADVLRALAPELGRAPGDQADAGALEAGGDELRGLERMVGSRQHDEATSWLSEALLLVEADHLHTELARAEGDRPAAGLVPAPGPAEEQVHAGHRVAVDPRIAALGVGPEADRRR